MLPDLSPGDWLTAAGFSLALGGLVLRLFIPKPSAKAHLAVAILLLVTIVLGIKVFYSARLAHEAKRMSSRIIETLGNAEKTLDQVQIEMNNPDRKIFARAITSLESEDRLDNRLENVHLTQQQTVQVRLWRVKTPRQNR